MLYLEIVIPAQAGIFNKAVYSKDPRHPRFSDSGMTLITKHSPLTINMSKYLLLIQKSIQKRIEYRSEILVWMTLDIVPMLLLLLIWSGIYAGRETIQNYTLPQLLQYYLLGIIIEGCTASHFESFRVEEIRLGKIDYFLTRPVSYLAQLFFDHLASKIFYLLLAIPVYLVLIFFINQLIPLPALSLSIFQYLQLVSMIILAFSIQFLFALITVLLGFWFEGADGLENFKSIFISLLSGFVIPVSMMPANFQQLIQFLPLKYLYSVPIGIIQQTYHLQMSDVLNSSLSLLALLVVTQRLWQAAKYRYASAGG